MTKYDELKTIPKAAYVFVNPKPAEVLPINVPVYVDNLTSKSVVEVNVPPWTGERGPREQQKQSLGNLTFGDRLANESREVNTTSGSNHIDEAFMREREKVRYCVF